MADDFLVIAITPVSPAEDEAKKIIALLEGDFDYVHIRHPLSSPDIIHRIVKAIPADMYSRIKLHDAHAIANDVSVGIHVNRRGGAEIPSLHKSCGCHSIDELLNTDHKKYEYVTLSPVFPSISKHGYYSKTDLANEMACLMTKHRVIALGGVTPDKFEFLKGCGFSGAALLGAIDWNATYSELKQHPYIK